MKMEKTSATDLWTCLFFVLKFIDLTTKKTQKKLGPTKKKIVCCVSLSAYNLSFKPKDQKSIEPPPPSESVFG